MQREMKKGEREEPKNRRIEERRWKLWASVNQRTIAAGKPKQNGGGNSSKIAVDYEENRRWERWTTPSKRKVQTDALAPAGR